MKRVKLTHGSARVADNCSPETLQILDEVSKRAYTMNTIKSNQYKYKIKEVLAGKPIDMSQYLRRNVPFLMGISKRTWYMWMSLKEDDHYDMGFDHLCALSHYLDVNPSDLRAKQLDKDLLNKKISELEGKFKSEQA